MLDTNNDVKIDHVCAVITTQNNGLIVVSRKGGEYGRLGMPGGKVDEAVESFALICKPEISPFYLYNQDVVKHCFVAPNDLLIEIEDDRKLYEELERRRDTRIKYIDAMTALIKTYPEEEFKDVLGNWYSADRRNTHCLV